MIRSALFDPLNGTIATGGAELIETWQHDDSALLWIDIEREDRAIENALLEGFDIHPLAIQDAQRTRHPPKIEVFDSFVFLLVRGLDAETTGMDFGVIQLSMFIGKRFLITRHAKPSVSINWLLGEVESKPTAMADGANALAVRLTNRLARRYVEILLDLEPRLDEIEEEMFERPNDELLAELTGYKSRLRNISRVARYHRHIASELDNESLGLVGTELKHEVTDLYEQVERTQSLADLYYAAASDLTDGYLALSAHRLNRVMQILTVITVVFVPMTFLAGVYGMNFQNMPELASEYGYFIVLSLMFVAGVIQFVYFRRRRWI